MAMCYFAVKLAWLCLLVLTLKTSAKERKTRSTDSSTYEEVLVSRPRRFQISNSDCSFVKQGKGCPIKYGGKGMCTLSRVLSQLFPDVDIAESTNNFIVPAKYQVARIESYSCQQGPRNNFVTFVARSAESVELVPQKLTLSASTRLKLSWKVMERFQPEKIEVKLIGYTSVGRDTRVRLKVEKEVQDSDYSLKFRLSTLTLSHFLAKFGVDPSDMINPDLSVPTSSLGLANLIMQEPDVDGLFSPGGGFEIIATGRVTAPELPADASKFYLIVQDFKSGSSVSASEGYGKSIAAVFALYENEKVQNAIMSLTGVNVPDIDIFNNVNQVAITAATNQIYNINSRKLRNIAAKYVPIEGMDMISKGLTVMHFTPNDNGDIKNKDQHTAERILFRCNVAQDSLTWTSPQRIETQMKKIGKFVWSLQGCDEELAIPANTKGVFVDLSYTKPDKQMEVSFNLTERIPVLRNGLVSLLNSTITLYSKKKTNGCSWMIRGGGKETILDELVRVSIVQDGPRTIVSAKAEIFDMQTLMNRTNTKPFDENYEKAFQFLSTVPFENLRYEAVFQKKRSLKFKGIALVDGNPNVELIYFFKGGRPQLKLGFHFQNQYLHKVVKIFYQEDKIKSTWIKFKRICVSVKNGDLKRPVLFDRGCIRDADQSRSDPGINFIAETLMLDECQGRKWKMCSFLKLHNSLSLQIRYLGKMLPRRVKLEARDQLRIQLGNGILFYSKNAISKINSKTGGDRLSFEADVFLESSPVKFPGRIYDDGTNNIMLHFETEPGSNTGWGLLKVPFAKMDPVRSRDPVPATETMSYIKFKSRLHIGTVESQRIEFSGHAARQFITYAGDDTTVKFVGEKLKLKYRNLLKAFALQNNHKILNGAGFEGQVIAAYTSTDEVWEVPEFDVKVKKGLHFYGQLHLRTGEAYETTVHLLDNMQLQTVIHLKPLRYGKESKKGNGKPIFKFINLYLHKDNEWPELGPDLVCQGETQFLRGYAETVGLEGPFTTTAIPGTGEDLFYQFKLRGNLYKEVDKAEVTLTTKAVKIPSEFKFKYETDITKQARVHVNKDLRNVLSDIKDNSQKGKDTASDKAEEMRMLLEAFAKRRDAYEADLDSIQTQIHNINTNVDLAMIDISTDCISQCKTVAMPGISWQQDCLQGSGGQHNMKCMTWSEDKEKVVNVMCLLKCEAKKIAAAGEAASSLDDVRILVNRYRERKVLHQNIGKSIELLQQADEIARETKELVESKTDIQDEVNELIELPGDLADINILKVDVALEEITPPCLPFQLDFTLKTASPTTLIGKHPICFNGEFYKNVGLRMMRMKYPAIDAMYKVLEEAELRYVRMEVIKKSLKRVEEDINEAAKRGNIPLQKVNSDPIESMLVKIAKRRVPTFTLRGDRTVLAFNHYSPWATIKRSNPFENEPEPSHQVKYNASSIQGKSACHQTKEVISEYRDISDNLGKLSRNYRHGKALFGKKKASVQNDLKNSRIEITNLMNKTRLSNIEKQDMLYWFRVAQQGMSNYLQTFMDRLENQNKRSLSYLRNHLSSFYGTQNFVRKFNEVGTEAISRSNINGAKRDKHIMALNEVGKELQNLIFSTVSLDSASAAIMKIKHDVEALQMSTEPCY